MPAKSEFEQINSFLDYVDLVVDSGHDEFVIDAERANAVADEIKELKRQNETLKASLDVFGSKLKKPSRFKSYY